MRAMTGSTRTIWIMAVTAVVSLAAGLGLSRLIVSPAEAAAGAAPPEAGPITVPVELRELSNDVVMRGDAVYEDPAALVVETGDIGGPAVVTGQVPEVGDTLEAGDVVLEVTGRPVILLAGDLPVYRTLRAGVSGPDVTQLKEALAALDIDPGDASSNRYDAAAAAAVRALYDAVGYPAPTAGPEAEAALDAARDTVRAAQEQVTVAEREVAGAGGALRSERIRAQGAVDVARLQLDERRRLCRDGAPAGMEDLCLRSAVRQLESELDAAIAARDEVNAPADTSAQRAALDSARRALRDAQEDLAAAQEGVLTPMPASEVVYLAGTPRRVDSVDVRRGSMIAGTPVMSVSGAALQIAGNIPASDADLVTEGSPVVITLPDGTDVDGTVQSVGAPDENATGPVDPGRKRVVVVPDELTEDQRLQLQGANVRVRIPVSATDGEVLAVPVAALTAGPGGESRVEVLGDDGESRLVTVETGLAAGGFVEVTATEGTLALGDRVVVGATGTPETEDAEG